jgi:Chromate transporter
VNTLPGPSGIQIGIFLGYSRAGWWGGVLAGLGFILPGFWACYPQDARRGGEWIGKNPVRVAASLGGFFVGLWQPAARLPSRRSRLLPLPGVWAAL